MTKRTSKRSSPRSTAKPSPKTALSFYSATMDTVKQLGLEGSSKPKGRSSAASIPTTSSLDLSSSVLWWGPHGSRVYVGPIPPTMPGSPPTLPSIATLHCWERMTHLLGGWAKQTDDPGWWLQELGLWCIEEASRLSAPTASSSNGAVPSPSGKPGRPPTSTAAKPWPRRATGRTPSLTVSFGTRRPRPSGTG